MLHIDTFGAVPQTDIPAPDAATPARKRPKPGERRVQILQVLAQMLEGPDAERVTTAALAARLKVSEAALYRHFAGKAQMFEALIDFIENSVLGCIDQIAESEPAGSACAAHIVTMVLQFGEKNPGMARMMVGDALVFEPQRLQHRMNQLFDKIEAALLQSLRDAPVEGASSLTPDASAQATASVLTAFITGRLQRFARAGTRHQPCELLDVCLARML
jgi:TetR/AcrR family transcriptional regulator